MSKSKVNKIVRSGTECRLPLMEGKKSFHLDNEDYKKYKSRTPVLWPSINN